MTENSTEQFDVERDDELGDIEIHDEVPEADDPFEAPSSETLEDGRQDDEADYDA